MEEEKLTRSVQLMHLLAKIRKNMMQIMQKTATENGLSVTQYRILLAIERHMEMPQKCLGEMALLPKSTLSQAVDGLVQEGWLDRQQVEGNRRETLVTLTEKGQHFLKEVHAQKGGINEILQGATDLLTDKQYEHLLEALTKMNEYLDAEADTTGRV